MGSALVVPGCSARSRPRNAVVIVLDTLRADRLAAYGYPRQSSPAIDRLAAEGVLFETVVTNASWTLPAMIGLMSGDFPTTAELEESLVERIRAGGLRTAAFVEGGFVSDSYGFRLGFDEFEGDVTHPFPGREKPDGPSISIEETFGAAEHWIRDNAGEPFFLLVHTYEPHTPYTRQTYTEGLSRGSLGETFEVLDSAKVRKGLLPFGPTERRYVRALYDGGVEACDTHVGRLLASLEEAGIRDETLVVLTSDHGEDLGGREPEWPGVHGHHVYDELVLVPLIIHDPTREYPVARVSAQVRTIDTMHTVLDLLGLPPVETSRGRSLVPLMEGVETAERDAWIRVTRNLFFDFPAHYALRSGGHKLVLSPSRGQNRKASARPFELELYDLAADPGERTNIAEIETARRDELFEELETLRREIEAEGVPIHRLKRRARGGNEDEARLRELGYVE